MSSLAVKIRRGEGPFWGAVKRTAKRVLHCHVPVNALSRPVFRRLYDLHVLSKQGLDWGSRFFWFEPLFRSRCVGVGERFRMERLPYMAGHGRITIGRGVWLSGKSTIEFSNRARDSPELLIGDDSFVGHGCVFHVAESVRIGRHCMLAGGVSVFDCDGHPLDAARRRAGEPTPPSGIAAVEFGDDVWVGTGAVVMKGVKLGDRSVVSAGSVVMRDVPADSLAAGNPARVVMWLGARAGAVGGST